MKKIFSLLLAVTLIVCATLGFSACGSTPADNNYRWISGEKLTYNISLAGALQVNVDNAVKPADETSVSTVTDQVMPDSATGTYTTEVTTLEDGTQEFKTVLNLVETYPADIIAEAVKTDLINRQIAVLGENGSIVITTTITSVCTFNYQSDVFPPVKSEKTVKGAYVGKMSQSVNDYKIVCNYQYGDKNYCDIVFTDNCNSENNYTLLSVRLSGTTFDNETLMLLVRSYDMAGLSSTSATVNVMEPLFEKDAVSVTLQAALINSSSTADNKAQTYLTQDFCVESLYRVRLNFSGETFSGYGQIVYYCDNQHSNIIGAVSVLTNTVLKFQEGYLVYTLNQEGLESLGYTFD